MAERGELAGSETVAVLLQQAERASQASAQCTAATFQQVADSHAPLPPLLLLQLFKMMARKQQQPIVW